MPSLSRSRNALVLVALLFALWGQAPSPVTSVHVNAQHAASSCALPNFPDATCTGYAYTGVTLAAYSGPTTITVAGTTIDSKEITSCLKIEANNVTIKRSYMHGCTGAYVIDNYATDAVGGTNLLIEDTKIECNNAPGGIAETAIADSNYTLRRSDVSLCENGPWGENDSLPSGTVTIVDNFIHNLQCYGGGDPHIDGVQLQDHGHDVTVQHNRIYGSCDGATAGQHGNSAVFPGGDMTNITVTQNLLAGGGWTLYCNQEARGLGTNNFFTLNRFYTTLWGVKVGSIGPTDSCSDEPNFSATCYPSGATLLPSDFQCSSPPDPVALLVRWFRSSGWVPARV